MKNILILGFITLLFSACEKPMQWQAVKQLDLGSITPIGIAPSEKGLWLADGDHNQVIEIDFEGNVLQKIDSLERPMHISYHDNTLYIPEYGSDNILKINDGQKTTLSISDSLDAPAGVDISGDEIVIADFYKHRVLFYDGKEWKSIGKKGKANGEFHYPTDVQLFNDKIIVADAYNHRVQIFDKSGSHLTTVGHLEGMNAATGIFVTDKQIYTTDFENNRVLIFDWEGNVMQTLTENIQKPTDILVHENNLYVINYKGKSMNVYKVLK